MRIGVSSRGSTWVSMGPIGWMIVGPFVLAFYLLLFVIYLLVLLGRGVVELAHDMSERSQRKHAIR